MLARERLRVYIRQAELDMPINHQIETPSGLNI